MNLGTAHHVAIIVSDIEKAKEFYVTKLGFDILHDMYRPEQDDYRLDVKQGTLRLEIFGKKNAPKRVTNTEVETSGVLRGRCGTNGPGTEPVGDRNRTDSDRSAERSKVHIFPGP